MPGLRSEETGKKHLAGKMFIVKIHKSPNGEILVVSDKKILGKRFEEGKVQLDLSKDFYKGEEISEEKLKELVKGAYVLHLTGEKTVKLFILLGLVEERKVLVVKGIPHAEVCLGES